MSVTGVTHPRDVSQLARHPLDSPVPRGADFPPLPQDRSFQPWTKRTQNAATLAGAYRSYCSGTLKDSWYESALAVCAVVKLFIRGQSKN